MNKVTTTSSINFLVAQEMGFQGADMLHFGRLENFGEEKLEQEKNPEILKDVSH